jgi:hypothetical protein
MMHGSLQPCKFRLSAMKLAASMIQALGVTEGADRRGSLCETEPRA